LPKLQVPGLPGAVAASEQHRRIRSTSWARIYSLVLDPVGPGEIKQFTDLAHSDYGQLVAEDWTVFVFVLKHYLP
jgi:hypothetical protein